MSRLKKKFEQVESLRKNTLVSFVTSCDPDINSSQKIINLLPECGVDIIEIGLPFSDPMADGPTIQKSSQRGIKAGFNMKKTFKIVQNFRKNDQNTPIIFMGYFNTIFQFGLNDFFSKSSKVGVDGIILVDLPPEEDNLILTYLKKYNIDLIKLITPTTDKKRLKVILRAASGFLYYVSIMGITGTKKPSLEKVKCAVKSIKKETSLPVVVGFGISKKEQISEISEFADGSVVGSSLVKIIEESLDKKISKEKMYLRIKYFLKNLK